MSTRVIPFRLDMDSEPGRIFQKWEDVGYQPRRIIENALRCLDGIEPQPQIDMNAATLAELQGIVTRLEDVAQAIRQNGGIVTQEHQQEINDALDPRFLQGMKRIVRPGFTQRPEDE